MAEKRKDERSRNWVIVFYPESAPENYEEIIRDWHVKAFLSPLHQSDINADGEAKKPHFHLLLMFSGNKSVEQIQELSDQLSGVKVLQYDCAVRDCKAVARYLIHLDNPEKFQYDRTTVKSFGGIDYLEYIETSSDVYQMMSDITDFIVDSRLFMLDMLMVYCNRYHKDWARVIMSHTIFFTALLRSVEYRLRHPDEVTYVFKSRIDDKVFSFDDFLYMDDEEICEKIEKKS